MKNKRSKTKVSSQKVERSSNKRIVILIILAIILLAGMSSLKAIKEPTSVVGREEVLKEIDGLLLPVSERYATTGDFSRLEELAKYDEYARDEVEEISLLITYGEYSHAGHSLSSLYSYVRNGSQEVCPGHFLAHYYVFSYHHEAEVAEKNFKEATEKYFVWKEFMTAQNQTYLLEIDYYSYDEFFSRTISDISAGKTNYNSEIIDSLVDAPCAE